MQRHAPGVDGGDTRRRGNDHPLGTFFPDLVEERGLACAGLACEKNILAGIAHVFEGEVEFRIGNEAHVLNHRIGRRRTRYLVSSTTVITPALSFLTVGENIKQTW